MEKDFKTQLYNKEAQIIQLQTKIDLLSGNKKTLTTPEIKRVFISNSSKGKQNINYNNFDLLNNKPFQKKDKNQTLDYISQLAKNKTINILNNNISIKTIKNYHPNSMSINNNINENKIPIYKFPNFNNNYKYESQRHTLEKNNSAPNIHLHNIDVNSNNVRKKFFLNNSKKNKMKNSKIKVKETGIKYLLKENRIARAINDTVTAKVLGRLFPGKPALAQFAWDTEQKRTSREVLEDAVSAKNAGLSIDIDQVSQLTGYKLEKAPETPPQGGFGGFAGGLNAKTALQTRENGLQNAPRDPDGQGDGSGREALVEALSGLFAEEMAKAAAGEEGKGKREEEDGASRPSQESRPSQNGEEITQEQAEKLYEEMMSK